MFVLAATVVNTGFCELRTGLNIDFYVRFLYGYVAILKQGEKFDAEFYADRGREGEGHHGTAR